jgi:hypothetical protein
MLKQGTLLSAKNLNNAYISKTDTNVQTMASNLTISGGALTLKNSFITDNASSGYMRIDPQGNSVIIYDGVSNQSLSVYSSSGSEATTIQTINASGGSYGMIDVLSAVDHLKMMTNTGKKTQFGGKIEVISGNDFVLKGTSYDAGDLVFQAGDGTEIARIYSSSGGVLSLSTGTATDAQIQMTDTSISLNEPTTVSGKVTVSSGGIDVAGSGSALTFTHGGGGFSMTDTTWVRMTGSKSFYQPSGTLRTDGTLQVGNNGATLNVVSGGDMTVGKSVLAKQFVVSGGTATDVTNNSPWYGIGRSDILYGTNSGGSTGVQVAGYFGLNLKTSNGELVLDPSYATAPKYNGNVMWHSGNMGASSNLDADKLDGLQGSQYLRSDTSDQFTGTLTLSGNQTISGTLGVTGLSTLGSVQANNIGSAENGIYLPFVGGGQYKTTTSVVTGAIAITLPVSWTSTMMKFEVDVYDYDSNESITISVAGYNYTSTSNWVNTTAYILSNNIGKNFTVRFGHDGTKCVVYIGEVTSTWAYPQIVVRNFYAGYQTGDTFDRWNDGWSVGFVTTLGTVTSTVTETFPRAGNSLQLGGLTPSQFLRSDASGTLSGNMIVTGTITSNSNISASGTLTAGGAFTANSATISGSGATPLILQRSSSSNVNLQFVHTSANAFLGINNAGDLRFGTSADLNGSGFKVWHSNNDGSGSGLDADTIDGVESVNLMRTNANTSTTGTLTIGTGTTSVLANQTDGSLRVSNTNGYVDISPKNTSFAHIYTDRPSFYFNKELSVNGNTVWNSGNDGAGSGLDADTVSGVSIARIPYGENGTASTTISDMDSMWKSGFYEGNDITNAPSNGWYWIMNTAHKSNSSSYKFNGQIAFKNISTGTPEAYIRSTASNITKTNWGRLWHDKNDGTGSGLDADLIRSQEPFIDRGYYTSANASANANNITDRGMYRIFWSGMTNRPTNLAGTNTYDWGNLLLLEGGTSRQQIFFADTDGSDGGMYIRQDYGSDGSWTAWRKIWDERNDGSGSGLDADKVDGLEASSFLRSNANDSFTGIINGPTYRINTGGSIQSLYNTGNIIRDHSNGNITLSAAGAHLYLGYENTTLVRLYSDLYDDGGTVQIIRATDGALFHKGTNLDSVMANKTGETWTGTHDLTGATLSWSRDTDNAKVHMVDYGADSDWLTIDFGDSTTDKVKFRNLDTSGNATNILDINGATVEFYKAISMNNNDIHGVRYLNGQYGTEILQSTDEWLRINDNGGHTEGVYFGNSIVRTDGELQVGSSGADFKAKNTGDVELAGNMYFTVNNKSLYMKNSAGTNLGVLQVDASNNTFLSSDSLATVIRGNALTVRPSATFQGNIALTGTSEYTWNDGVGRIGRNTSGWVFFGNDTGANWFRAKDDGTNDIVGKTYITSTSDVSLTADGGLTIGSLTAGNMSIDTNEIQARSNGTASVLNLNILGGNIVLGSTSSSITSNGLLTFPTGSKVKGNGTGDANTSWLGFYESNGTTRKGWVGDGGNANSNISVGSDSGGVELSAGTANLTLARNSGLTLTNTSGELQFKLINTQTATTVGNVGFELRAEGGGLPYIDFVRDSSDYTQRLIVDNTNQLKIQTPTTTRVIDAYEETTYSIVTSGWYDIAYNGTSYSPIDTGGDRALATFYVDGAMSGRHDAITFIAGTAFGVAGGMNINVLGYTKYNNTDELIGGIRIVYGGTYHTQYLQMFLWGGATYNVKMKDNHWNKGWTMVSSVSAGSIPTGYSTYMKEIQGGFQNIPRTVLSGTGAPPTQGSAPGDVYIQY